MQLTDAEWKVMHCLWEAPEPANARDVMSRLGPETEWAYTTVKTLLARLVEKGAVRAEMRLNTSFYIPLTSRSKARTSAVRSLVERVFAGAVAPLITQLVSEEKLSGRDRIELRRLIEESLDSGTSTKAKKLAKRKSAKQK